jgi:hypothetical protein
MKTFGDGKTNMHKNYDFDDFSPVKIYEALQ